MSVNNRPADAHAALENFKYNIFNVIPNPVKINEGTSIECIPPFDFWAEGYSCHAYNTLKNYVLGFLIFLVIYGFLKTNKYQDRVFWQYLQRNVNFTVYMLAILPDVFLAVLVNAVAPLTNSVLSLGFLFSLILILWYGSLITGYLSLWTTRTAEQLEFLRFYIFNRSDLTRQNKKIGLNMLAIFFDDLKVIVVVIMIGLFNNSRTTQFSIVILAYLLNALFLIGVRPYQSIWQNIFYAISDISFFILILSLHVYNVKADSTGVDREQREGAHSSIVVIMVWIIFLVNLFVYLLPVLKGKDTNEVIPESPSQVRDSEADGKLVRGNTFNQKESNEKTAPLVNNQSEDRLLDRQKSNNKSQHEMKVKQPEKRVETADGNKSNLLLL